MKSQVVVSLPPLKSMKKAVYLGSSSEENLSVTKKTNASINLRSTGLRKNKKYAHIKSKILTFHNPSPEERKPKKSDEDTKVVRGPKNKPKSESKTVAFKSKDPAVEVEGTIITKALRILYFYPNVLLLSIIFYARPQKPQY